MKRIVLINPRGASSINTNLAQFLKKIQGSLFRHYYGGFGLGLLVIAALTPKSFDIKLIDENFETIDFNEKYDLVALSAMTQQATRAYQIADEFRKKGIKVAIGGIHATVLPEEAKQHADSVIVGEAEEIWPRFIEDLLNDNIQPFYRSMSPADLTKSPVPRYDLLKPEKYKIVWVQTTRGCPHGCEFCVASRVYGTGYRHKSLNQVISELKFIKSIWRNPQINFADDNMFVNKSYSIELVKNLIPLKIRWSAQTDISAAEDEFFLKLLKKSGCMTLFIGFETLSEKGLKGIDSRNWKLRQLNKYPKLIEKIQSYGIGVLGAFIMGLDSDDTSVFKRTIDFIINNHLYASQITVLTPLPGTRLRQRLIEEDRILSSEWDKYTFSDVNFKPKQMHPQVLQAGILKVYQGVYNETVRSKIVKYFKEIYSNLAMVDKH